MNGEEEGEGNQSQNLEVRPESPYKSVFVAVPDPKNEGGVLYQRGFETEKPEGPIWLELLTQAIDYPKTQPSNPITHLYFRLEGGSIFHLMAMPRVKKENGDLEPTRWTMEGSRTPGKQLGVDPNTHFKVGEQISFRELDYDINQFVDRKTSAISKITALGEVEEVPTDQLEGNPSYVVKIYQQMRQDVFAAKQAA